MFSKKFFLLPTRDFLKSLADDFVKYALQSGEPISRFIFIMPNRRSGVYLKYYISKRLNSPSFAPQVFSIDDFIDFYYENYILSDVKITSWDAEYLLYDIFKKLDVFSDFWEFVPFGSKILRDFEDFKINRRNTGDLQSVLIDVDLPNTVKIKRVLDIYPDAYEEFYRNLAEMGFSSRSLRYYKVSDEIASNEGFSDTGILLCPPFLLSECEKVLLEKLLKWDNFAVLLQKSKFVLEEYRDEIGMYEPDLFDGIKDLPTFQPGAEVKLIPTDDDISEVLILEKELKNLDEEALSSIQTGIILPDAHKLFEILDLGLPNEVDEFNISMGYPVRFSGYYSFIRDLTDLLLFSQTSDREYLFNLKKLRQFVDRHVELKNHYGAAEDFTSLLGDLIDKGYTYLDTSAVFELIDDFSRDEVKLRNLTWSAIFYGFLKKLLSVNSFSDFVQIVVNFLSGSEEMEVEYKRKSEPPGMLEELLIKLLALKNSLLAKLTFQPDKNALENAVNFLEFLSMACANVTVPLKGTPLSGLQIIGFLESRLLSFKKLFILDAQENLLPEPEREWDGLMPYDLRLRLGLLDLRAREKLSEYLFFTLVESSEECTIIYKDTEIDEPSHFLLMLKEYMQQSQSPVTEFEHMSFYSNKTIGFDVKPSFEMGIRKTEGIIDRIRKMQLSYSALETYLECPLKFLFSYIYKMKEEMEDEFDRRRIGSVIHRILEEFFKEKIAEVTADSSCFEDFERVAERVLNEEYPIETTRIRMLKEGIKVRVKGSLRKIQRSIADKIKGKIAGNFEGYRVEVKADSNLRVVGDVLLPFTGKIDRIDLYGDGVIIIDYKSSSSVESYERGAKIENLTKVLSEQGRVAHKIENPHIQLPVYYWLVKNSPQIRDTVGDLSNKRLFVSVVPLKSKDVKISIMEYENGESNAEQVEQCLRIITNEILDPSVEFYMPLESKRKTYCSRCSFNVICGTA